MEQSNTIVEISKALVEFQGKVSKIAKNAKNPFFKSNYVTLDKLIDETRKPLTECGLSVVQIPTSNEKGEVGVKTMIVHESGEFITSDPIFLKPVKQDPQAMGSCISYARRYSYQAVLNLNTGEDDDANLATHWTPDVPALITLGKELGINVSAINTVAKTLGVNQLKDLTKEQYETLVARMKAKAK